MTARIELPAQGIVQYFVISNSKVGRSVDETLRVIAALQSGGLCPMDWNPGEKTISLENLAPPSILRSLSCPYTG